MKYALMLIAAAAFSLAGCQSTHQKGVTSDYRTQWTKVAADTKTTTDAAKAVLDDAGLKDVKASSTNVDGQASGKEADGTNVNVSIQKEGDTGSQVAVNVGTLGDPTLGANLAKKIKTRAEGH